MGRASIAGLCALTLLACSDSEPGDDGGGGGPSGSPPPAELVGTWLAGGWVPTPEYYDPTSGSFTPPSGVGSAVTFLEDGTYGRSARSDVTVGVCTTTSEVESYGVVDVAGDQVTFHATSGQSKTVDSCTPDSEVTTPIEPGASNETWVRTRLWSLQLYPAGAAFVGPGAVGDPCTDDSQCKGGHCTPTLTPGDPSFCASECQPELGCTERYRYALDCGQVLECQLACLFGPEPYIISGGDPDLCSQNCYGRGTVEGQQRIDAYAACAGTAGCAFDQPDACPNACPNEYQACVGG